MADPLNIELEPGTLPPPACYATEQDRFNAYVASILVSSSGGTQWVAQTSAPADLTLYWLKIDGNNNPIGAYQWSTGSAAWVPWQFENVFGTGGGTLNAFTMTNSPALPASALFMVGRVISFISTQDNTGPSTLVVDGGPSHAIKKAAVADLAAGDIVTGQVVTVVWDGTNWQMINPINPKPTTTPQYFTSTLYAFPGNNTAISVPHPLTVVPPFVRVVYVCNTPEGDYSALDELDACGVLCAFIDSSGSSEERFDQILKWSADASVITLICQYFAFNTLNQAPRKSASTYFTITPGFWNVKVYAYVPST